MNSVVILAVVLLVVVVAWVVTAWQRGRSEAQMAGLREEMQTLVSAQAQALTMPIGQLTQSVNQQLGQVTAALHRGLADSGLLVSKAQEAMSGELRQIAQQLGAVQKAEQDLHQASQTLQQVLGGAKTRGTLGEIGLERILEDSLPRESFEIQYRFTTGSIVDAIVRSGEKIVSIDSKFPLDDYRRLIELGEGARKDFAQAVRKHADSIGQKYILPSEGTLDFALMFVPSESVYYELLMTEDAKGRLDTYCRSCGVVPVSPNTLYAYLGAILIGLKGLRVEENARRLLGSLAGLKRQLDDFADIYERLGKHLHNAQQSFEEAESKLGHARGSLEQMAHGALPEAPVKALESAAKD